MGSARPEQGLRIVGLLGGIGSGKSAAAGALATALPAALFNADAEVAALLSEPALAARIEAELGPGLLAPGAGGLDRRALGKRVFRDPEARRRLEQILHPEVRQALHRRLGSLEEAGGAPLVVLDVPLLLESGLDALCDALLYVEAPSAERCRRACARHGWSPEDWAAREAVQLPVAEKRERADAILDNTGSQERLQEQARAIAARLRSLPPSPLRERWPRWDQPPFRRRH